MAETTQQLLSTGMNGMLMKGFIHFLIRLTLCWIVLNINDPVAAQDANEGRARAAFRLGQAHYENGNFVEAAKQFEKAYELSKRPQLLYNIYLAYRDAIQPEAAARALRQYLEKAPDIENRFQLEARLRVLEKNLDKPSQKQEQESAVQPEPAVEPEEEQPSEQKPAPEETQPSVQEESPVEDMAEDKESGEFPLVPVILMGSGGAMVLGSVITGIMTTSAQSDLEDKCPDKQCQPGSDWESTKNSGQTLAIVTDVLLFGGIAVAGVGLVLLLLDGDEADPSGGDTTVALGCVPGLCGGSVELSF